MRIEAFRKIKRAILPLALFVALILSLAPLLPVLAGNARLYLSPSSGTKYVGSAFSVFVKVNSGSHATNAYKAVVRFPTALLSVTSVSVGSSICTLQITGSPSYSNSAGTVNFECGHTGSFSGSSGTIGNVTFLAKAAGTANLTFSSGQVKAADGSGTEVLGSTSGASFEIQLAPPSAPAVSSLTHPDQNSWYAQDNVALSWTRPASAVDFSYALDQKSDSVPDEIPEGTGISATYRSLSDGVYYFHIRARGAGGWSDTAHFRIRVDTSPPDPFELTSEPSADNVTVAPLIIVEAVDRTSGISHYELSFEGSEYQTVTMPYQFPRISEGKHTITVRAFDKAGNYREGELTLNVVDVEEPIITRPVDGALLPLLGELIIEGTSQQGLVELYLNGEFIALVESGGRFEFTYTAFLKPGPYTITAKFVTEGGVESSPVEVHFRIDPRSISIFGITLPGWLVYSLLLGTIAGLIFLLLLFRKRNRERERHFLGDLNKIERTVDSQLELEEKEIDRTIEEALRGGRKERVRRLEKKLELMEGKTREDLINELERIKQHHRPFRLDLWGLAKRNLQLVGGKLRRRFTGFWHKISPFRKKRKR